MGYNRIMLQESLENITTDWKQLLETILLDFPELNNDLIKDEIKYKNTKIFPPKQLIFNCFNYFNIKNLKVVIIGQDPYHQINQAHGLCFSVQDNIKIPPSLLNIFKEIYKDKNIKPKNGNLEYLSKQGVLLLNNTLTVLESKPNSHLKYWKGFTQKIIDYILENCDNIVFLLWGNNAKSLVKNKNTYNHYILESVHPSPLSANRGGWFGNNHFNKTNIYLKNLGKTEINFKT